MGLNDLRLPASLVADLYRNTLVGQDDDSFVATPVTRTPEVPVQFLGKNQQKVSIVVNYEDDVYLPEEQLNFLTSILQACHLNLGDVAIVNFHQQSVNFQTLRYKLFANYIIIFGINPELLQLPQVPLFSNTIVEDCRILYSVSTDHMNNTTEGKLLKSKLWLCLKQWFVI